MELSMGLELRFLGYGLGVGFKLGVCHGLKYDMGFGLWFHNKWGALDVALQCAKLDAR